MLHVPLYAAATSAMWVLMLITMLNCCCICCRRTHIHALVIYTYQIIKSWYISNSVRFVQIILFYSSFYYEIYQRTANYNISQYAIISYCITRIHIQQYIYSISYAHPAFSTSVPGQTLLWVCQLHLLVCFRFSTQSGCFKLPVIDWYTLGITLCCQCIPKVLLR